MAEISLHEVLKEGGFEASLITTFNAYLPFYEEIVLSRLRAAGCRHNVVLMDAAQCHVAYASDETRPRYAGREYTLVPMRSRGAFHPKIFLLVGRRKAAIFVGSHNLTLSGFGYNREATTRFEFKPGTLDIGNDITRQAWRAIEQWLVAQGDALPDPLRESVRALSNFGAWLRAQIGAPGDVTLLAQTPSSPGIWTQLRPQLPERVKRIVVVGPFFDSDLALLAQFRQVWSRTPIVVGVDPATAVLPEDRDAKKKFDFRNAAKLGKRGGYLHAKCFFFDTGGPKDVLVVGSANPSAPAWLGTRGFGNDEAVIVRFGQSAGESAAQLGLLKVADLHALGANDWHALNQSRTAAKAGAANHSAPLVVAHTVENGLAIPVAAMKSRRPRSATVLDSFGTVLLDEVVPLEKEKVLLIQASGDARQLASMIVLKCSGDTEIRALVHQTYAVQELMRSGKQAQLRASLAGLSAGTGDLVKVIAAVEKVIFDEPEVESTPRRHTPLKGHTGKNDEAQTKPESLAGSIQDQKKRRAHRRLLETGDLAYLLDVLIRRLGVGLERDLQGRDDKGRTEEELAGTDDADDHPPAREELDDAAIAKLCRSKARRLVVRMVKQMEQAARSADTGPTVLIQLVAVLAILRELRLVERMPRWASIRESLVSRDDEESLLNEVLTNLFGRGFQLYEAIKAALGDERFDELARLKGLLIWLAWDCEVELDERFDIREEPGDVRQRLVNKAALLEFAQMLKGDFVAQEEAANSILQTVKGSAAAAASRWIAGYFGWSDKLSRIAIPTALPKGKPSAAIAVGDLAVLTTDKPPKLRVVSAVTGQQVSLIDFGDEDGEIKFLRDRVVAVAR